MKTFVILSLILSFQSHAESEFKKTKMKLGSLEINVEVADTDSLREKGLMGRTSLADTEGMIFVFQIPEVQGFWMKNTLIPLSIGYFDKNGKLFQVMDMTPASPMDLSPKVYRSTKPALFALEEPLGWFKRKKIQVNRARLSLPELHLP